MTDLEVEFSLAHTLGKRLWSKIWGSDIMQYSNVWERGGGSPVDGLLEMLCGTPPIKENIYLKLVRTLS